MTDEGSFDALSADELVCPGPPAVLLCGHSTDVFAPLTEILEACAATTHRVVFCAQALLDGTVAEALTATVPLSEALPADALPSVVLLSGMTGAQIHGVIDRWRAAHLPPTIWASTTPANLEFSLKNLLRDLLAEQRALAAQRRSDTTSR